MKTALVLAARGLGQVWPNPAVGCVLVREGRVVARGWTQKGGRPHAETEALARAGDKARGATAYVSLEPCAHQGETPPCADALVDAGVVRVVVAAQDPDPRVAGRGIARLRQAGVDVIEGVCREEAERLNSGFVSRITRQRPLVTLKLATTLDGRIATHTGQSKWITGEPARQRAHYLRANHDAILVGAGTVLADDPELSCRLPAMSKCSPVRVIADSGLSTPLTARLVRETERLPTWLITHANSPAERRQALKDAGVELIDVERDKAGYPDLALGLETLAERGITRLLVEGGGRVAASMLRAGLVDRIAWFYAPKMVGSDGMAAVAAMGIDDLEQAPTFDCLAVEAVGNDILETLAVRP